MDQIIHFKKYVKFLDKPPMKTMRNPYIVVKIYIYKKLLFQFRLIILENINAQHKSGSAFNKNKILIKTRRIERKKWKKIIRSDVNQKSIQFTLQQTF